MSRKPKSRVIARVRAGTLPALDELGERRLEKQLTERATQWRETLANETPRARAALRELLAGPIRFVPQRTGGYELRGSMPLGALLFGPGGTRVKMAYPGGTALRASPVAWEWRVAA